MGITRIEKLNQLIEKVKGETFGDKLKKAWEIMEEDQEVVDED